MIMTTVTLEYSNNNRVLNGILEAVAKMPDVKMVKTLIPSTERITAKRGTQKMSTAELYRLAEKINNSVDPTVPVMTMEEIVQEVRDYRNGK
jgi:hypothetical protein